MPPANTDANTMNGSKAVEAATRYGVADPGMTPTAVRADVTIPGTIPPPDTDIKWRTPIQDQRAWIVTFPFSGRRDVDGFVATAYNVIVDAESGEFVWGFYTKWTSPAANRVVASVGQMRSLGGAVPRA
jgi:hypothetical protein